MKSNSDDINKSNTTKSTCLEGSTCKGTLKKVPETNTEEDCAGLAERRDVELRVETNIKPIRTNASDNTGTSDVSSSQIPRVTGLSCQALKHAVCALNRLDDFIMETIGAGFFSEVFKVTHKVTGKVMVLKMNLSRSNRPNMLKEVQLMNQLKHPNILKFQGVCVHEGQLHALTEYINGGSLEQLIQNRNIDLPYLLRQRLALDIALGMEYLHGKGVFHRDLTSKNVLIKKLLDGTMQAVVGDFGLAAKIPDPKSKYRLPTVGSAYWMSPECLKGELYNEKSDVFSYGIVLCELIARIEADPDVLPRTDNFGLDYLTFTELCGPCPPHFLKLTFSCCNFVASNRPSFTEIVCTMKKLISDYEELMRVEEEEEAAARRLTSVRSLSDLLEKTHITTRSDELINLTGTPSKEIMQHKKVQHRRSLSDELSTSGPHTAPSDKARCHYMTPSKQSLLDPKHVGESMIEVDPHYKPRQSNERGTNPFLSLSQFRGAKKILGSHAPLHPTSRNLTESPTSFLTNDLFSSCFELPSPFYGATPPSSPVRSTNSNICCPCLKPKPDLCLSSPEQICCYHRGLDCKKCVDVWRRTDEANSLPSSPKSERKIAAVSKTPSYKKPKKLIRSKSVPFLLAKTEISSSASKRNFATEQSTKEKVKKCILTCEKEGKLDSCPLLSNRIHSSSGNLLECDDLSSNVHLRRRGSCESGFFSCIGEDIGVSANELVSSSEYTLHSARSKPADTSSTTLSSSPVSSLFFLDDSSHSTTTVSSLKSGSGDFNDLDDLPSRLQPHPHTYLLSTKRSSSIYTDSSEDISSLADNFDERGQSAQITKIVEYFERKQMINTANETRRRSPNEQIRWEGMEGKFKKSGMSLCQTNRKSSFNDEINASNCISDAIRKSKIQLLRKSLERGTLYVPGVNPLTNMTNTPRRTLATRLMICEGAVKSKLPLFDKKN